MTRARSVSPNTTPSKRRKVSRGHKNELIRMDPTELAEQLALFEYRLYIKVRPKDCIIWSKTQAGEAVASLIEFCATHDRIAGWVKSSILQNEGLGKRADTIDFWIRVAEVCQFSLVQGYLLICYSEMPLVKQFRIYDRHRGCFNECNDYTITLDMGTCGSWCAIAATCAFERAHGELLRIPCFASSYECSLRPFHRSLPHRHRPHPRPNA